MKRKLTKPNLNSQTTSEQKWKAIRAETYYPWNPALFCTNSHVSVRWPYQLCKLHFTISHSNSEKAEWRESEQSPHAAACLSSLPQTLSQRYVLEIPLISDPGSGAPGSASQLSGATGEERACLTLVAPESSGSAVNDWFTFTVSTVSHQTFTNQTHTDNDHWEINWIRMLKTKWLL